MSRASLATAARCDETDRLARNGRGSNRCPGSFLYTRWIKMDDNLQAPEKAATQAEMKRRQS